MKPKTGLFQPFLAIWLSVLMPLDAPALAATPLHERDRSAIDALLAGRHRSDAPGCAVGVYREGAIVYSGAFGMADLARGERITPATPLNIASMGKQFTAAAILLLARDGKLSLDDDIRRHLPEFPNFGTITIRQLLTHTSGVRDYRGLLNLSGHRNDERVSAARILNVMTRQRGLNFAPGEQFQYSNGNYFLAGLIVERASGESYVTFVRRRILEPLGMAPSRFRGESAGPQSPATHYASSERDGFRPFVENWEDLPPDLYSSIHNLARWDANFYSGDLGGEALVRAMESRGVLADGREMHYALGLVHGSIHGHAMIGHDGGTGGSASTLRRFPQAGLSIAVLCNRADGQPDALAAEIVARLLPRAARPGLPAVPGLAGQPGVPPATWIGSYRSPGSANLITVAADGEGLAAHMGSARFPLRPLGGNVYQVIGPPTDVFARFEPATRDRPRRLVPVNSDDPPLLAFEFATPTSADLAVFAGAYRCPEIEATIRTRQEGDGLVADMPLGGTITLRPLERGAFAAQNLVFTFDEAVSGISPGFRLDQWRSRGLRCERTGADNLR